ncbi:DUF2119 family protein [Methanosarcina horonobensis]|uniref:DUF2119 family protein n=1 Tax=Methanosarcina horonobensis TaxID=418008 RepID=UPI000A8680F2
MTANEKSCFSSDRYNFTDMYADEIGLKVYGHGEPVRLFVAGLHGDEWKDTTEILMKIKPPERGTLALIPLVRRGEYISTLDPAYYSNGKRYT